MPLTLREAPHSRNAAQGNSQSVLRTARQPLDCFSLCEGLYKESSRLGRQLRCEFQTWEVPAVVRALRHA